MNNTYIQELLKLAAEKKGQKGKNQGFPNPSKSQKAPMNSKMQGLMDNATGGSENQRLAQALSQTPAAKAAASNSGQPSAPVKSIPTPPPAPPTQTYPVVSRADRASAAPAASSSVDTSKFNTSKGGLFRKFRDQMKFKQTLKDRATQEAQWASQSGQSAQQAVRESMPNSNRVVPRGERVHGQPMMSSTPAYSPPNFSQSASVGQVSQHGATLVPSNSQVSAIAAPPPLDTSNMRRPASVPAQAAPAQVNYGKPMTAPASVPVATPTPQNIDTSNMGRSTPSPGYAKPMEAPVNITGNAPTHVPVNTSKFNVARAPKQSMSILGRVGQWLGSDAAKAGGAVLAAGAGAAAAKKKAANEAAAVAATSAQPHVPVDTSKFNVTRPSKPVTGMSGRNKVLAGLGMLGTLGAGIGAGKMMSKEAAMARLLEHGYDIDTALKLIDHTENH